MNQDLPTIITGTAGDDTLVGTPGIDLLRGLEGNDTLLGGEGHDFLLGDEGDDRLIGDEGHDFLIGGDGNDNLQGGEGHDLLIGDEGNDHLYGGAGVDFFDGGEGFDRVYFQENFAISANLTQGQATYTNAEGVEVVETLLNIESLFGTAFDDHLTGDAQNNSLFGAEGNDTLLGGAGNDGLYGDAGVDFFDGGEGIDTVNFRENFAITADLTQEQATYINAEGVEVVETLLNIENLVGTALDDQLIGDGANNYLFGNEGNDILRGNEGNDILYGDAGVDYFDGGEGIDTVNFRENFAITADLTQGQATYINADGVEVVETLLNIERLVGTAFDDQLIGDAENNVLTGLEGNDTLRGNEGNDALYGGAGVDFFDGGEGNDSVYFRGNLFAVRADLTQEQATYINEAGVEVVETLLNIESLGGTEFDDQLIGNGVDNGLSGGNGNDTLIAGAGNDRLHGGAGIDFLDGGEGIDTAVFTYERFGITADLNAETVSYTDEQGNAIVEVLRDIERIQGTDFDDQLIGNAENNNFRGYDGNDILIGGAGNDHLYGDTGIDFLDGGEGFDSANFTAESFGITANLNTETASYTDEQGNLIVEVMRDIERIYGTLFDDWLIGNGENNILWGFDGDDTLIGGAGDDGLKGGTGADTFAFLSSNQGIDTITDFNSAQGDIIQISASGFGAGLTPGVLDSDQFIIGSTATDGGDRIIYNNATGALFFDPDGTGTLGQVEFARLSANPLLTSNDILVV